MSHWDDFCKIIDLGQITPSFYTPSVLNHKSILLYRAKDSVVVRSLIDFLARAIFPSGKPKFRASNYAVLVLPHDG